MKSLRFNPETSLLPIPTLASMSDEQLEALYYCDEASSSRIYQDVITNIHHMQRQPHHEHDHGHNHDGSSSSSPSYCPRGLEHVQSSEHSRSLKAERDALYDALLNEQDRQWEVRSGDSVTGSSVVDYEDYDVSSERLAHISRRHSADAVQRALRLAQADADFVASYNPPPPSPEGEAQSVLHAEAKADDTPFAQQDDQAGGQDEEAVVADVLTKVLSMSDLMTLDDPAPALLHVEAQPSLTSSSRSSSSWPLPSNATATATSSGNMPITTTAYQRRGEAIGLPRRSGSDISSYPHHRGTTGRAHGSPLRRKCTSLLDLKTLNSSQHATTTLDLGGGSDLPSSLQAPPATSSPVQGDDDYLFFQLDS